MVSINPIVVKELRSRMRGGRTSMLLTAFLVGLAAICFFVLRIYTAQSRIGAPIISAQVGKGLFTALALTEMLLVAFLTPAVTAGAISSEREQLTYDLLVASPLRPGRILFGKLIATLSYILLLIFTAVPLGSLVLIFGGVTPRELLFALLLLVVTALCFGMIGLLCSSLVRRTLTATILAYGIVLVLIAGSSFAVGLHMAATPNQPPGHSHIIAMNPFNAMASIVVGGGQVSISPLRSAMPVMDGFGLIMGMPGMNWLTIGIIEYGPNGPDIFPAYRWTIVGYCLLGLACYWVASHLVRPRRRWRLEWPDLILPLLMCGIAGLGLFWLDIGSGILQRLGL